MQIGQQQWASHLNDNSVVIYLISDKQLLLNGTCKI